MSEPKKHHYLPQFYLNSFQCASASKKEQIVVYNKNKQADYFISAIDSTGCERDYHTLDHEGLKKDRSAVEQTLSRIETEQASLLKEILENKSIEKINKTELASFISIMRNRNPSVKDYIERSLSSVVESTANIMDKNKQLPEPPEAVKKLMEDGKPWFEVDISNWYLLYWMFQLATNPGIISLFSKMRFSLLSAPESTFFITSDSPVSFYVPQYDKTTRPYGAGLAHPDIEVTLPLSSKFAISCSWKKREPLISITEHHVLEINRRSIIMARNYIYSHLQSSTISDVIKENHNISAGHQISTLKLDNGFLTLSRFIPVQ